MKFKVASYSSHEHKQALDLRNEFLRKPIGLPLLKNFSEEEKSWIHFVAIDKETVVGCVVAIVIDHANAKLRQMAVHENFQFQGVGTKLLGFAEAELKKSGIKNLLIHARMEAVGFYEKAGYVKKGEQFYEVSVPHFAMLKSISE